MSVRRYTPAGTLFVAAVALVIGLEAPAVAHQVDVAARRISGTTIKVHSIPGNRLKGNTVTGRQVKESTLGVVPEAHRLPALKWHDITLFKHGWANLGHGRLPAAYALDAQGIVHLRGSISGGGSNTVAFTLPASMASSHTFAVPVVVDGAFGYLSITNGQVVPNDGVGTPAGSTSLGTSLAGVTFPVG